MSNRRRLPPPPPPEPPTDEDGMTVAPCGCRFGVEGETFIFEPHDGRCTLFRYYVRESTKQGKPIQVIDTRDVEAL